MLRTSTRVINVYSCIAIYAHRCLKPFSIGPKTVFKQQNPCSNHEIHVLLNLGFGRRHWPMRRDVMCFVETKWPTLKKLRGFR